MEDNVILNIDNMQTVGDGRCTDCGKPITPHNDSGWEVFVSANESQPICWVCQDEREKEPQLKIE